MGNCQANDAAAVALQHPDGHIERLYWPTKADAVMRNHPGHYVAHLTISAAAASSARFTKIRLLKHKEMLLVGQVYRLMTSEEVTKELRARKQERIRRSQNNQVKQQQQQVDIQHHFLQLLELQIQRVEEITSVDQDSVDCGVANSQMMDQAARQEREKQRTSRTWRPSLDSISEIGI